MKSDSDDNNIKEPACFRAEILDSIGKNRVVIGSKIDNDHLIVTVAKDDTQPTINQSKIF